MCPKGQYTYAQIPAGSVRGTLESMNTLLRFGKVKFQSAIVAYHDEKPVSSHGTLAYPLIRTVHCDKGPCVSSHGHLYANEVLLGAYGCHFNQALPRAEPDVERNRCTGRSREYLVEIPSDARINGP